METLFGTGKLSQSYFDSLDISANASAFYDFDVNASTFFDAERQFDYRESLLKVDHLYGKWLPLFSVIYLMLIFGGMRAMKARAAFRLTRALRIWNFLLAAMSIVGTWRTLPEAWSVVSKQGAYPAVCISAYFFKKHASAFWALIFTVSKLFEFGDTFFLVARKRPVIFLHWYHHISVMFFSYYCFRHAIAVSRWFMVINFLVHSVMYSYYMARSMSIRVPKVVSMLITSLQIFQMVVASGTIFLSMYYKYIGLPCSITIREGCVFSLLYGSYFVLFGKYFANTYIRNWQAKKIRTD
ncbi:unnamed protein product [Notodromas monacha]|uniref:Elongation of very long chain fatty acids protein n=1 Tax=Notodromas monacha TaxID=399045 RepID=A0A7R9G8R9_9CRUS|nr:unnamed protein product [Notodromas monacha]CAG0913506.1 unnamed protein product [Notodromas monacha]